MTNDISSPQLGITLFPSEAAQSKAYRATTLEELRDGILATSKASKVELPWLKAARFGDKRTKKNSLRHDANVEALTGICVDYDEKQMIFEEIVSILRKTKLHALVYTSPTHRADAPKWRIVLPLSKEIVRSGEGKEQTEQLWKAHHKLVARINGLVGGELCAVSFNLSQSYYWGSVNHNPDHRAEVINGRGFKYIDQRDDLDAGAMRAKAEPTGVSRRLGDTNAFAAYGAGTDKAPWAEWIIRILEGADGTMHDSTRDLSGALRKAEMSAGAVVNLVRDLMKHTKAPHDDRWHDRWEDIPRLAEIDDDEDEVGCDPPYRKSKPKRTTRGRWREVMDDVAAMYRRQS
jgi:hypothetical protein